MTSLKKGIFWSAIDRFSVIFIQIIIEVILARIIDPKNYGIIGLASIFLVFGNVLLDSGFSKALIQNQDRTEKDYSTMFYLNFGISLIVYLIFFLCSDSIADYFNLPDLSLIIKVLSINILITGLALIQRTKLTINLDFKTQAKISLVSILIAGSISVFMAYKGFGVWALIAQSIMVNFVSLILYFINNPVYPSIKDISQSSFKRLLKFGGNLTLSSLLQAVYQNSFTFVIGKKFSTSALGMYNKSNQFTLMPISVLTNIVNRVTYPEFSKFQNDNERLAITNLKFAEYFSYIVFPLFIFFASISFAFIKIFLGSLWLDADVILKILSLSYILYPFTVMNMTIFQIKDRTKTFFQIDLSTKIVSFIFLCAMIPLGIEWVCLSIGISQLVQFLVSTYCSSKLLNSDTYLYIKRIGMNLIYFVGVLFLIQFVNKFVISAYLQVAVSFFVFFIASIILLWLRDRRLLSNIISIVKLKL